MIEIETVNSNPIDEVIELEYVDPVVETTLYDQESQFLANAQSILNAFISTVESGNSKLGFVTNFVY